jgi:Fur family ferric uptake transcriptional regulator
MDQYAKNFAELLKKQGYSVTKPRKIVFEVLYSYGLQNMNQLISRSKSVNRASVYRAIDVLDTIGAINRVPQGFKYKVELSEKFLPHHHHIICTTCGRQSDIEQTKLEEMLISIAEANNFTLGSHKVELQGICSNCRN